MPLLDQDFGRVTTFLGVNVTFLPMHMLGLAGMPRRIPDYSLAFIGWNYIATIGSIITFISTLVFFVLPCFMNVQIFLKSCKNLGLTIEIEILIPILIYIRRFIMEK